MCDADGILEEHGGFVPCSPVRATHKGNFLAEFGIDVECYVLDDEQKSAVISQRGMGATLGLGAGGSRLTRFIGLQNIAKHIGPELAEKLSNPLIFRRSVVGLNRPHADVHGYDVTILIDICKAIVTAEAHGDIQPRQASVANQARVILNASAKAGIKGLVYALAGYDTTREEIVAAFKFYVRTEAREYEKEFPEELYAAWYRLYQLPQMKGHKPWKFKTLTVDHVYAPLARSSGKVLELTRAVRATSGERHKKLHQFLSEVGVKALRRHLGRLLGVAETADDQAEYERRIEMIFGREVVLNLSDSTDPTAAGATT